MTFLLATLLATHRLSLVDLDLRQIRQGWGTAQKNRSITENPISIGGRRYEVGIGTHANSTFRIKLDRKAVRLHAWVGVDDNAVAANASIRFRVVADSKPIWQTPLLHAGHAPIEVNLPLKGVRLLSLEVDDGGNGIDNDHADWAEPTIEYDGAAPTNWVAPVEKPYILTPPPPKTPRINGPTITGARPGSPFLFQVPATGIRPMTFTAKGLPAGLKLDSKTGRITGALKQRGTTKVILTAKNRLGSNTRTLRIVGGDEIALTPHMGWNSWYVWLNHVSDRILRDAADAMVTSDLINHGWQYVNIDDCWARIPGNTSEDLGGPTRDANGEVLPNGRFPDMRGLTSYIHSKGLKAGIYTSPGPTTCAGYEGAFRHEAQDAATFANWGFDFLKYDWCSYKAEAPGLPGLQKPYQMMGDALKAQPRDIVLNLCQYGMGKVWQWGKKVGGHSWRTADDLGATYRLFEDSAALYAREHIDQYGGVGAYNDPDYLLLGKIADGRGGLKPTPFTPNEQYLQVSLWALFSAPLIYSGDIAHMDDFTRSLLTNDEVIAVDQDALCRPAYRVAYGLVSEVWSKPLEDGSLAVGLINRGEEATTVRVNWGDLGLKGRRLVRDLWRQKDLGRFGGGFSASVPRHGVVLVKVSR